MKKKDLKTGYIVELRKGEKALIVRDNCYGEDAIIFSGNSWSSFDSFDDDLKWSFCSPEPNNDIMKVYKPDLPTGFLSRTDRYDDEMELIWERKEEEPFCILDGIEYSKSTLRSLIKKATR